MKPIRFGLQARFLFVAAAAMLVVVAIVAAVLAGQAATQREVLRTSDNVVSQVFDRSARTQGTALATALAEALVNPMYFSDLDAIGVLVRSAASQSAVSYVLVHDNEGRLIHDGSVEVAGYGRQMRDPLAAGMSRGAAADLLALPDPALLDAVARAAGLERDGGRIRLPGSANALGPAEAAVAELERRLAADPFHAPEADDLTALALGVRELAAAERAGRVLRLRDGVVLLPGAPALAMRELARLPQPFTTSQARQALGTTRRVAIPLLEHLDGRGWTRRLSPGEREVVRAPKAAGQPSSL